MVRIATIGLGGLGNVLLDLLVGMDGVEISAGADVSPPAREHFEATYGAPAYESYRELLSQHADLDAAIIVTPHTRHYEEAVKCLANGVDVLVEKPMVTKTEHAVDLVERARAAGAVLEVGYQRRYHPIFREMKRVVDSGRIGDLHTVNCYLDQEWLPLQRGTWRVDPDLSGGGQLYDTGSHLLDAMLWTTGTTPKTVAARIDYFEPGVDVNSALAMELEDDGRTVTASATVSGDGVSVGPEEAYVFCGTDGRLAYTDGALSITGKEGPRYDAHIDDEVDFATLSRDKLENFVAAVDGTAEPAATGEHGLQVVALTEAAYTAATEGRTVDVQARIDEVLTAEETG